MRFPESGRLALAACLLIVILSWGLNYPLMKLALRDISPLAFAATRILGGALFLAVIIRVATPSQLLPPRDERWTLAWIGILQYSAVLGSTGFALLWLPAGRTVTIVYTMPVWAALFDFLFLRGRLKPLQIAGIMVSCVGILLFMDPGVLDWSVNETRLGMGLAVFAAICWGLGAVIYTSRKWESSLMSQAFWQLLVAGLVLSVLVACAEWPLRVAYSPTLITILVWNWVVPVSLSVWAWGKVLQRIPASIAGQALLCTPFVGIALSAWIFGETLPAIFAVSALLIVVGAGLVLFKPKQAS